MFTDYGKMLESADRLMREAGKIILSAHDTDSEKYLHVKPGTKNFATDFDIAVQNFLLGGLKKDFPDALFIAEEKENDSSVLNNELVFIVDPIDGTNCFMHNCRQSSISIGVISCGEPVFGAVYNPYTDELFHAAKGCGAFVNSTPMHVSERPMEMGIGLFGTCPYYKDTLSEKAFAMAREIFVNSVDIHRSGSAAIDLCNIANGTCECFFEMILQPWDIAAGKIIIEEAGGIMTEMTGAPIDFSKPVSVLATNKVSYNDYLKITKKYF